MLIRMRPPCHNQVHLVAVVVDHLVPSNERMAKRWFECQTVYYWVILIIDAVLDVKGHPCMISIKKEIQFTQNDQIATTFKSTSLPRRQRAQFTQPCHSLLKATVAATKVF